MQDHSIQVYANGVEVETVKIDHPRWDYRVTARHADHHIQPQTFVSGGTPIVEAVQNRLYAELSEVVR